MALYHTSICRNWYAEQFPFSACRFQLSEYRWNEFLDTACYFDFGRNWIICVYILGDSFLLQTSGSIKEVQNRTNRLSAARRQKKKSRRRAEVSSRAISKLQRLCFQSRRFLFAYRQVYDDQNTVKIRRLMAAICWKNDWKKFLLSFTNHSLKQCKVYYVRLTNSRKIHLLFNNRNRRGFNQNPRLFDYKVSSGSGWDNAVFCVLSSAEKFCWMISSVMCFFRNSCFSRIVDVFSDTRLSIRFWIFSELGILVMPKSWSSFLTNRGADIQPDVCSGMLWDLELILHFR